MPATEYDPIKFHEGLVKAGLIVPVGVQGAFGRNHVFEDVLDRFNACVTRLAEHDHAEYFVFPPVIDRKVLEKTDYMDSFPHLAGTVHSFFGKELDARKLSERIHAGEPWGEAMGITGVTLNPAACYPVYPSFTGTVPAQGRLVTMLNWVYRHEPSPEPTRMQAFRVREFVRCGTPDQVVEWRDMWLQRGLTLLQALGLPAAADVASDPFFGKGGKMLAASQREQKLKFEVLVPVISTEKPTAVCSFNFHEGHFGEAFEIKTPDGNVANTACLGFGLERVVMALFQTHGFDPGAWPSEVRAKLWPER
jgi:seryl-tRNA synthetase